MNTKVTRKQVEEARNYLYNINTQLGMTLIRSRISRDNQE